MSSLFFNNANFSSEERVFVYEVLLPSVFGNRQWLKVPYHCMSKRNREISLLGGKIITILPLKCRNFDDKIELAWWLEIITDNPRYFYFFGPFESAKEGELLKYGYVADLLSEGGNIISTAVKYCQPYSLTIEF